MWVYNNVAQISTRISYTTFDHICFSDAITLYCQICCTRKNLILGRVRSVYKSKSKQHHDLNSYMKSGTGACRICMFCTKISERICMYKCICFNFGLFLNTPTRLVQKKADSLVHHGGQRDSA